MDLTEIWDDDPFDVEKDKHIMKEVARQERELKKKEKQELAKKKKEDQMADKQGEAGLVGELPGEINVKKKRKTRMAVTQDMNTSEGDEKNEQKVMEKDIQKENETSVPSLPDEIESEKCLEKISKPESKIEEDTPVDISTALQKTPHIDHGMDIETVSLSTADKSNMNPVTDSDKISMANKVTIDTGSDHGESENTDSRVSTVTLKNDNQEKINIPEMIESTNETRSELGLLGKNDMMQSKESTVCVNAELTKTVENEEKENTVEKDSSKVADSQKLESSSETDSPCTTFQMDESETGSPCITSQKEKSDGNLKELEKGTHNYPESYNIGEITKEQAIVVDKPEDDISSVQNKALNITQSDVQMSPTCSSKNVEQDLSNTFGSVNDQTSNSGSVYDQTSNSGSVNDQTPDKITVKDVQNKTLENKSSLKNPDISNKDGEESEMEIDKIVLKPSESTSLDQGEKDVVELNQLENQSSDHEEIEKMEFKQSETQSLDQESNAKDLQSDISDDEDIRNETENNGEKNLNTRTEYDPFLFSEDSSSTIMPERKVNGMEVDAALISESSCSEYPPSLDTPGSPTPASCTVATGSAGPTPAKRSRHGSTDTLRYKHPVFPASKLFEYQWSHDGAVADWFFLQEQLSEFLDVKSFRRKFPELTRRPVDVKEREYLRDRLVVTETQCDLGLTAVRSEEVLDMMAKDYPEKHRQYSEVIHEREKQKKIDKHKEYEVPKLEKDKMKLHMQKAMRSASERNAGFIKERKTERRAYFDQQTFGKKQLKEKDEEHCNKKRRKWCTIDLKDLSFTGLIRKETNTMPSDDEEYDNSDDPDYKVESSESEEDDSEPECTETIYPTIIENPALNSETSPNIQLEDTDPDYKVENSENKEDDSEPECTETINQMIIEKPALNSETSPNIQIEDTDKKLENEEKKLISVMGTSGTEDGYRVYDKKMYCPYCSKPHSKLPRHLISKHGKETEVIKYEIEKDKGKKEKMICKLRNLGNYLHNNEVMKEGKGVLVVKYRPSEQSSWEDYVPCDLCLGYYVHWDIWKHRNRCIMKPENKPIKGRVVSKCRLLIQNKKTTTTTSELDQILVSLTNDDIGKVVKTDTMILQLGEKLSKKVGHDVDQFSCVRNTMRELGRLLIRLREIVDKKDAELAEFVHPAYFKTVVQATKDVAGYDEVTHLLKTPSLALKIGSSLRNCATIRKRNGLEELDENLVKESSYFDQLCEENWAEEISTHALRTLGENKRNKAKLIPLTSDCQLLTNHLKEKGKDAYQALEISNTNTEAYKDLCEVALTQIILFNRRRQGEVSKMKIEDYLNIQKESKNDVQESLSDLEKKLCKSLTRVEIVGKRGRTVPVILTMMMKMWLDLLVQARQQAGVTEENKFVFARVGYGSLGHIRGSDSLRKFSVDCGAKQPNLLRSTKLRKQIATLSQILNLKENELDILANFLGHDVRIHREFYRLPQHTLEIAKVSKLLISLENGEFSGLGGKSLAEIEVNLDEDIGVDVDESSDNEEVGDGEDSSDNEDDGIIPEASKKQKNDGGAKNQAESRDERTGTELKRAKNLTDHSSHRKFKARPWSEMEKTAVLRHFRSHIVLAKIPKKEESEKCIKKEPCLSTRTWKNVKDFVRNRIISTKNKSAEVF